MIREGGSSGSRRSCCARAQSSFHFAKRELRFRYSGVERSWLSSAIFFSFHLRGRVDSQKVGFVARIGSKKEYRGMMKDDDHK